MGKTIGSVILGYLVMVVVVFGTFSLAFLVLGTGGSFREGSYDISSLWIVVSIILGFIAAVVGGLVCLAVAREERAAHILALVVIALGIVFALPQLTGGIEDPGPRPADMATFEAMQSARQPTWLALLNPLIGAAGILTAVRLKKKKV
jgi:hypothetical protein